MIGFTAGVPMIFGPVRLEDLFQTGPVQVLAYRLAGMTERSQQ